MAAEPHVVSIYHKVGHTLAKQRPEDILHILTALASGMLCEIRPNERAKNEAAHIWQEAWKTAEDALKVVEMAVAGHD